MAIRLNEDKELVAAIKEGLKKKNGYCPCRLEMIPENKCICQEFKEQMNDPDFEGYCHCMLYYKSLKDQEEIIMAEVKLTSANFENEVLKSDIPVVVDFWATWCGPCKMIAPHLEELAKTYDGKIKVGKVNVDEELQLATKFGIASIPTLMLFKDGKLVNTAVGYMNQSQLENFAGV